MSALPVPVPGSLLLLLAPRSYLRQSMPHLISRLALAGPLTVVDGGNLFDLYSTTRQIRRASPNLNTLLQRVQLARAFTCYQVVSLLEQLATVNRPLLVIDLLATFYDENVSRYERRRLLQQTIAHLRRLSAVAPLAISAALPADSPTDEWIDLLATAAQKTWRLEGVFQPHTPRML